MSSARQDFWTSVKRHRRFTLNQNQKTRYSYRGIREKKARIRENLEAIPTTKYQYTNLPDPGNCIRILEVQAGHYDDVIVCRLKDITLSVSVNHYEALSYVWTTPGEEVTPITIRVNDGSLEIRPSLHCALRFLRSSDQTRFLWVDAICIDQSSLLERDIQVPLMCEIYRNATSTICFLGSENRTTRTLFNMLEKLAEEAKTIDVVTLNDMDTLPAFVNHLPVHPVKTRLFDEYVGDSTIVDIVQRTWWHRAWTVQEIMLSSNAIMMIGKYTITWQNFCAAVDHGLNMQIWGPVVLGFIVNPVVVPYISMRALMNRYRRPNQLGSPAVDLLRLLMHCRHRESTDPRDKIYAVLGLLRDTYSEALKSDGSDALDVELGYNYDIEHVYRHMCQELIRKTDTLDVLGICPKTNLQLPSWVTDWSATDRIGSPLTQDSLDRTRRTHATKRTKANARFSSDGSRLILSGFELASIVALSETLPVPNLKNLITDRINLPNNLKFQILDIKAWVPAEAWAPNYQAWVPDFESMAATTDSRLDIFKARLRIDRALYTFYLKLYTALFVYLLKTFTALFVFIIVSFAKLFVFILKSIPKVLIIQYQSLLDDGHAIMAVFYTLFTWEVFAAEKEPTNPGLESREVYWYTLCSGTYKNSDPVETKLVYQHWSNLIEPLRKFVIRHNRLSRAFPWIGIAVYIRATWDTYGEFWPFIAASQRRRMGRLENGWLSMLPGDARVGDIVVLARGGKIPLVVREGEGEMGQKRIVFVGETYVHGIMDGEAWEEERCKQIEIW